MVAVVRAWIGCLASYNSGNLHGEWVDLSEFNGAEELEEAASKILRNSPADEPEEWIVFDWEDGFGLLQDLGESGSAKEIMGRYQDLSAILEKTGNHELARVAISWLRDKWGRDVPWASAAEQICDCFFGMGESAEDIVEEWEFGSGSLEDVPSRLIPYIDFSQMARDLISGGEITFIREDGSYIQPDYQTELRHGTVYAFSNR